MTNSSVGASGGGEVDGVRTDNRDVSLLFPCKAVCKFMSIPLRLTLERLPFGKAAAGEGGASPLSFCTSNLGHFVGCGLAVTLRS